jgi:glycine/D-amino acid oxidase-like deaminating enzyme
MQTITSDIVIIGHGVSALTAAQAASKGGKHSITMVTCNDFLGTRLGLIGSLTSYQPALRATRRAERPRACRVPVFPPPRHTPPPSPTNHPSMLPPCR